MGENREGPSWMGRLTESYSVLWKMVIRPPRDVYPLDELGPAKFRIGNQIYERKDLRLQGVRGFLECSHFTPTLDNDIKRPCVVYLHGNCSSRLEAFDVLPMLLPRNISVFCLDLSGSGRSTGEYISLGYHEEKDLQVVLQHLRCLTTVSRIALWGRSMGATTCILRAAEDCDLSACVLDSAFSDLRSVAEDLVSRGRLPIPGFLFRWILEFIRAEVSTRAGFDLLALAPIEAARKAKCPAVFAVAYDDDFVLPQHSQDLHDAWAGDRSMRVFDGGHNGARPIWFLEEAADFLADAVGADRPVVPKGAMTALLHQLDTPRSHFKDDAPADGDCAPGFRIDSIVAAENDQCTSKEDDALAWLHAESAADVIRGSQQHLSSLCDGLTTCDNAVTAASQELNETTSKSEPRVTESFEAFDQPGACAEPRPVPSPGRVSLAGGCLLPRGVSVFEQLYMLGFGSDACDAASKRFLSVETAMQWLAAREVTVHL